MRKALALAVGCLLAAAGVARAQAGYQYSPIAPDPLLKSVQTPESVLMRAAYEARHRDCVDAGQHLDAVQKDRPRWAAVFMVRLICARSEAKEIDERAALDALTSVQPGNWIWWRDSAALHARDGEVQAAVSDVGHAISLRTWDATLYGMRSEWRERLRDFGGAFADAAQMHLLEPSMGAPLERMAKLAVSAGHGEAEAKQDHALAELNPEQLPMATRDDTDLPTAKMTVEETLLRAGYALRVGRDKVALKLVRAVLAHRPETAAALAMYYPLWKRGMVDADAARQGVRTLLRVSGARAEYCRWLMEMGVNDGEQLALYRAIVAAEPFEAKGYAELAAFQLRFAGAHGAMEPTLPTNIPWAPSVPAANAAAGRHTPLPAVLTGQGSSSSVGGEPAATAEGNFQLAIGLDPGEPAYYAGLAQALDKRSAFPLELMALNMALIGDPENKDYQLMRSKLP